MPLPSDAPLSTRTSAASNNNKKRRLLFYECDDKKKPRLQEKIADGAYERRHANVRELPERERADNLIFGVDELRNLILHTLLL
jgi:hypothetical protein